MQNSPTITDWMQGIGTLVALGLSAGSLFWQWRARLAATAERINVEAVHRHGGVWTAEISVKAANRSTALVAEVVVQNWSASRLYHDDGPPWFDMDSDFRTIERTDWTALRRDTETHLAALKTDLFFEEGTSTTAHGYFAIVPSEGEVELQITIKSRASGKKVMRRRLAVSPVDQQG